jgi:hypothetical protein
MQEALLYSSIGLAIDRNFGTRNDRELDMPFCKPTTEPPETIKIPAIQPLKSTYLPD